MTITEQNAERVANLEKLLEENGWRRKGYSLSSGFFPRRDINGKWDLNMVLFPARTRFKKGNRLCTVGACLVVFYNKVNKRAANFVRIKSRDTDLILAEANR